MDIDKVEICIIEDEAIIAEDIKAILEDLEYSVSAILHSSDEAIDYLSFHTPDLVLCDINIKGARDGIEVAQLIRRKKSIPFVFLTSLSDRHTISRAKHALPYGYVIKPFDESDLLSCIEVALFKFNHELNALRITHDAVNQLVMLPLTSREFEILQSMVDSLSFADIAEGLGISKNTLKFHTKNIYVKFDASNRADVMQSLLLHYTNT